MCAVVADRVHPGGLMVAIPVGKPGLMSGRPGRDSGAWVRAGRSSPWRRVGVGAGSAGRAGLRNEPNFR